MQARTRFLTSAFWNLNIALHDVNDADLDAEIQPVAGSDIPGSLVCLQVQKDTGEVRDVLLARTAAQGPCVECMHVHARVRGSRLRVPSADHQRH